MNQEMIDIAQHNGIAVLTMRHGKANALDVEFCEAIAARFDAMRSSDVRAVVITGQGKIFSAGVDLVRLTAGGPDYVRKFLPALHKLYNAIFFFPKPVVAAVNGHAIAGGCVLAACADRKIIGRDGGRVGLTELLVGVPFPALAFEVMRSVVPNRFFPDTVLSGATFPPEAAVERGMIDEVVEPAAVTDRAMQVARTLAALSPEAVALTKHQLRQPVTERLERDGARIDAAAAEIWANADTLARIRDYVSKTFKKG
jgi:enoyl-CoA hydratase